jgi:hypothetical protein
VNESQFQGPEMRMALSLSLALEAFEGCPFALLKRESSKQRTDYFRVGDSKTIQKRVLGNAVTYGSWEGGNCDSLGGHLTTWVQLGSICCRIRYKTEYHDTEQSQTNQ